jgi:CubicO group peptidase (beta-lactamase class C family)
MEPSSMSRFLFLFLILSFNLVGNSVKAKNTSNSDYQAIVDKYIPKDGPGVSVIMSQNGKVIFQGAQGMANIEHQVPLTTDSVFRLGSITKQFTTAAIMMLQEQGKLSINDDIKKYVPDFPTEGNMITIENLMTHTSGIANYTNDRELFTKEIQVPITLDDMLKRFEAHPMTFKTGDEMRYSNTGYVLLGKIIEVASGQSYAEFIEQNIFKKLGMNSSRYGGEQIIPSRASGYESDHDEVVNASHIDMSWPHAAGSLLSTVGDLKIWNDALQNGTLISKSSYQKMIKPFELNNGEFSDYGYGFGLGKLNKYDTIEHGGGIPGFITWAVYIPSEDLYVAALTNSGNGNPGVVARSLIAEYLEIDVPTFKPAKIDHSKAKKLLGTYKIDEKSSRSLLMEDGKYYTERETGAKFEVIPYAQNGFYYEGGLSYIEFTKNSDGQQVMNFYFNLNLEPQKAIKE